ncbi:DUF3846 domain-containing protein [Microbacterium sp. MRS-1]|uniref:DUF3846 domain-containing protein n=1 Tax=Microbacterium sp. MRS-1 TaxID=1451261 RepID=UPI00044DF8D0|nr:DUF3846 domain-containing protein [Microbacterium sp. MRS-1]EXJ50910.1 hypothetical protein AS96_12200 [Microbacterium sp. MRS-1]
MPKGIYIPADQEAPLERRDLAGLEDYQAAVGGYIEAVDLPEAGATLFVNEEGLLRKLLFNPRATFLWWFWVPAARHKAMLVGDAILVGSSDQRGDETDVAEPLAASLLSPYGHRVEVLTHGDPTWYGNRASYPDYFEAAVWAMTLLERWTQAADVRILPLTEQDGVERGLAAGEPS